MEWQDLNKLIAGGAGPEGDGASPHREEADSAQLLPTVLEKAAGVLDDKGKTRNLIDVIKATQDYQVELQREKSRGRVQILLARALVLALALGLANVGHIAHALGKTGSPMEWVSLAGNGALGSVVVYLTARGRRRRKGLNTAEEPLAAVEQQKQDPSAAA